ncbi:MAG: c-type cytochrome [Chloroflexota bacterium]
MNFSRRNSFVILLLILVLSLVLTGCTPDANAAIISPRLGQVEATATAQPLVGPVEEVEEVAPPTLAELSTEEIRAGLPEEIASLMDSVDPANGPILALANACQGCHINEDPNAQLAGPNWIGLGDRSVLRAIDLEKDGPAAYLYESIIDPNTYIVDGYQGNQMPATYLETLSDEDLATLIVYILSQ